MLFAMSSSSVSHEPRRLITTKEFSWILSQDYSSLMDVSELESPCTDIERNIISADIEASESLLSTLQRASGIGRIATK